MCFPQFSKPMFSMSPKFKRNKIVPITCGLQKVRNGEIKVFEERDNIM